MFIFVTPRAGSNLTPGTVFEQTKKKTIRCHYIPNFVAIGSTVIDKKVFKVCTK